MFDIDGLGARGFARDEAGAQLVDGGGGEGAHGGAAEGGGECGANLHGGEARDAGEDDGDDDEPGEEDAEVEGEVQGDHGDEGLRDEHDDGVDECELGDLRERGARWSFRKVVCSA